VDADVRVTFLLDSPNLGGAEVTVLQLVSGLEDVDATVLAAAPASERFLARARRHATVRTLPPVGRRHGAVGPVRDAVAATEPDVVHVNLVDPASNEVLLAAAAAAPGPTVATCHMVGTTGDGPARARLAARYAALDHTIAVSLEVAGIVRSLGVGADDVTVVTNGVELREAAPRRARPSPVRLGTVARLTPQKGIDVLLTAVAELRTRGHDVELVVAGDGRDRATLERAAAGLPVSFLGHVDDVGAVLSTLDVFVLASRAEGLPLALLEAMAAGLPCVATEVGDVPAAVGDAAVVVPPEDAVALAAALDDLVGDGDRRETLGDRGRARAVARLDVARTVAEVRAVYARAVASAPRRGAT
jgi:glycosyltransferase involved in cell wall biosynthesis